MTLTLGLQLNKLLRVHSAAVLQAVSTESQGPCNGPTSDAVSRTLHVQAAKVVAAHAASMGDSLLGVPLMCSAGRQHKMAVCMTALVEGEAVRLPGSQIEGFAWQDEHQVVTGAWQVENSLLRMPPHVSGR